ncbi:MAG: hypothetical protein WCK26_00515 [Candidatus Saccharibacteria bacterium]
MKKVNGQYGAVSLFVVIFAALLITVVTVSFVRIMIQSQKQASTVDLSQSAYDSAQAGVEDAKRALLRYQSYCKSHSVGDCATEKLSVNSDHCNEYTNKLDGRTASTDEQNVQTGDTANDLNQAYTCVTITTDTTDYLGYLNKDESNIIPISGVGSFDKIKIDWFSSKDLGSSLSSIVLPSGKLLSTSWQDGRPPILRSQLIQYKNDGFILDDFNGNQGNGNSNTLFLYPTSLLTPDTDSFITVGRRTYSPLISPNGIKCLSGFATSNYSCSVTLKIPPIVSPLSSNNYTHFLRLTSLYRETSYKISLINGNIVDADGNPTIVQFNGVQPSIDSTGRANDLFRRVQSRVEFSTNFSYPEAAVDISGNLCKDFRITDDPNEYYKDPNCTP